VVSFRPSARRLQHTDYDDYPFTEIRPGSFGPRGTRKTRCGTARPAIPGASWPRERRLPPPCDADGFLVGRTITRPTSHDCSSLLEPLRPVPSLPGNSRRTRGNGIAGPSLRWRRPHEPARVDAPARWGSTWGQPRGRRIVLGRTCVTWRRVSKLRGTNAVRSVYRRDALSAVGFRRRTLIDQCGATSPRTCSIGMLRESKS
jgi:hypothetical protein